MLPTSHARCICAIALMLAGLLATGPDAAQAQTDVQDFDKNTKKYSHISFQNQTFDFGTVPPLKPLKYTFIFKNTGSAPLLIEKVKAG